MKYSVRKRDKTLRGEVKLDGSKSITNRIFIIKALTNGYFNVKNYSGSEDSNTLFDLINSQEKVLNAKDGGTTLRFLLALLTVHEGEVILTGSERLIDRPVGPLVEALNSLGADIQYLGKKNYPPLLINGRMLQGNRVDINASVSSQFITALLLIAPVMRNGLIIRLRGEMVSRSYIELTFNVMKHFGIRYDWSQSMISIPHQQYAARDYTVESDWSAASYFYEMAAFADEVDLKLCGLNRISSQGDAIIARLMEQFGITTTFVEGGIHISKRTSIRPRSFEFDFRSCPDIAPTMMAVCAGLKIPARFSGISHLRFKESDRIRAMQNELSKLGISLKSDDYKWTLEPNGEADHRDFNFNTYNDHRLAMSLAPLALLHDDVEIDDPTVVRKSYPGYWEALESVGFEIENAKQAVY